MCILTNQALLPIPADLTPLVKSFVGHVTRSDWKTCKVVESNLIKCHAEEIPRGCNMSFAEDEYDEIKTWTLAGQKLILKKTNEWTHQPFPMWPPEPMEDFDQWYQQHLLWHRYGRYFTGQMN
jgi:hypothetical protein